MIVEDKVTEIDGTHCGKNCLHKECNEYLRGYCNLFNGIISFDHQIGLRYPYHEYRWFRRPECLATIK